MKNSITLAALSIATTTLSQAAETFLHLPAQGEANGKHVVLLSGDEEYRSEEAMPMLGSILAKQGFECTILFSLDDEGKVAPKQGGNLTNSEALDKADAIVMSIRFRHWDDASMERFEAALNRGTPLVALRTSTHAFNFKPESKWAKYSYNAKPETGWEGGFGRQVLGESWVSHHGKHGTEGTRSLVEKANAEHPVLNGVGEIFGTSDVYGAAPLAPSTVLLRGQVTETLEADSAPVAAKNDPMQPIAWTREFKNAGDKPNRVLTTTMGAATDLLDEDLRRLVINGVYWGLELPVPAKAEVSIPASWKPTKFAFNGFKEGLKPSDFLVK
ncbi:ThuA domain-containing protein [Rubritalea marina]|uniref:ThuA domain-containing protein n=1 Tax=Rubritalea marina TaxID=361055 RepID=UPI000475B688|nr:ThuA domain-containing protein [Rubritalea marina]